MSPGRLRSILDISLVRVECYMETIFEEINEKAHVTSTKSSRILSVTAKVNCVYFFCGAKLTQQLIILSSSGTTTVK